MQNDIAPKSSLMLCDFASVFSFSNENVSKNPKHLPILVIWALYLRNATLAMLIQGRFLHSFWGVTGFGHAQTWEWGPKMAKTW